MMLTTMVIESVLFGEAELVEADATGFALAGVAVPKPWVVERDDDMVFFCQSRSQWKKICGLCREGMIVRMKLGRNKPDHIFGFAA